MTSCLTLIPADWPGRPGDTRLLACFRLFAFCLTCSRTFVTLTTEPVSISVRTSIHKTFFPDLNEIWYVGTWRSMSDTRRYAVWSDPRSRSRSRRSGMCKNGWFQTQRRSPPPTVCMQSKDWRWITSRQYLNFNRTCFWYSSSFGVTWPSYLGCSTHLWQRNFASNEESTRPAGFFIIVFHVCLLL